MSIDGNKIMSVAAAKVLYDDLRQRVNNKLETNLKGAANGLAELDSTGKVPANQLPSYVDDVLEFATLNNFPVTGESGKIYIALDTNLTYRWSGSTYTIISSSLALGETESTAYRGDRGAVAYNHATNKGNAYSKGLYKITTNAEGHVINTENVIKQDITNLGIPGTVPTKVSQLQNDSGFISSYTETDPTVPAWAKSPTKPIYTANEVGALPDTTTIPSKVSDLINDAGYLTQHQDISGKADIEDIPTKVSDLTNDAGYLTEHQDISGKADIADVPTKVSDLVDDSGHYTKPSGGIPASDLASGVVPDLTNYVQKTDYISDDGYGIARTNASLGVTANSSGIIRTSPATSAQIKAGTDSYKPISPAKQHEAVFYGLAKAAGDATQASSSNAVGTYTDDAKFAIRTMLDVPSTSDIPGVPVTDVQVNGTSILSSGVANIPRMSASVEGVAKTGRGIRIDDNALSIYPAWGAEIKAGTEIYRPITASYQHQAAFYGLAKAAGDTTQAVSSNAVGTYTSEAKSAIQAMLDVPSNSSVNSSIATAIGNIESFNISVAQTLPTENIQDHTIYFIPKNGETNDVYDEYIYINNNWEKIGNTQVDLTGYVRNTDYANQDTGGVVKIINQGGGGFQIDQGYLLIKPPSTQAIKAKINTTLQPIIPGQIDIATFYGLAYAAGDTTQSQSDNSIGTYTTEAKAAIRSMIGAENGNDIVKIQDTQPTQAGTKIWMPETTPQGVQIPTYAEFQALETSVNGKVNDVQIDSTSIVSNGTATIPIATDGGDYGLVKLDSTHGSLTSLNGTLVVVPAYGNDCKNGNVGVRVITPYNQHQAVFYGLAKVAGDTSMRTSNNVVGTYTDSAKNAIKTMLDVGSITETVSGTTLTITATENHRYICGEVTSLNFTPCASGICDVRFTSGSTVAVLTIPSTVKWPAWFDPALLEANTIYELNVLDGVYGAVMAWPI